MRKTISIMAAAVTMAPVAMATTVSIPSMMCFLAYLYLFSCNGSSAWDQRFRRSVDCRFAIRTVMRRRLFCCKSVSVVFESYMWPERASIGCYCYRLCECLAASAVVDVVLQEDTFLAWPHYGSTNGAAGSDTTIDHVVSLGCKSCLVFSPFVEPSGSFPCCILLFFVY